MAPSDQLAEVRKSLTLDWMAAEDSKQRELVSTFEKDPGPPMKMLNTDCIAYLRPAPGKIGRLLLELLRNLEGDDSTLIMELIQILVRSKLLVETSALEAEPDFEALIKTPKVMMGQPHATFPRILSLLWMVSTDPDTIQKYGWCPISKMNKYLSKANPAKVAKQAQELEPMIARVRYIMEEFIQAVTPLNVSPKKGRKEHNKKFQATTSIVMKKPLRDDEDHRVNMSRRTIGKSVYGRNSTFLAQNLLNLDSLEPNTMAMTGGASTFELCRFVILLGNVIWITMMIYDL